MTRNSRRSALALAALLTQVGCGLVDGLPNGDAAEDTGGQDAPREGLWDYVDGGVQENTCGSSDVEGDPDLTFVLVNDGGDEFVILQNSPYDDFTCTESGDSFACPERLTGETPIDDTDIVLSYSVSIEGTIDDPESMTGTQRFDITCAGSQCAIAGTLGYTFPCYYTVAFTASWDSEY